MKRIIIAMLIMACAAGVFAGQGDMQLGPTVGLIVPAGDAGDLWTASPKIGGRFIYGFNEKIDFEGDISYGLLQVNSDYDEWDVTTSWLEVSALARYKFPNHFYAGGGLGYYKVKFEYDWGTYGTYDASSDDIGIIAIAGYEKKLAKFTLDPQVKLYVIDGDLWMDIEVGFNFPIGK